MRFLFLAFRDLSNPYVGGGDIYINEIVKGCAQQGHHVTMISSKFPGSPNEEVIENVHIIRVGSGRTMLFSVFIYYLLHLRGKFDFVVEEIMGGPRIPFFATFYIKERLIGILQQKHKEIFWQQFSYPIAFFLSVLERFLVLLYRNNILIVNSLRTKEDLRGIGYIDKNMHVIYPGLPNYFLQSENMNYSARKPRVVCLTKIRRYKLIDYAIRAMVQVCKIYPRCELVIAGRTNDVDPEYENEIRRLVYELNLCDNVHFAKDISEKQKIELLQSSIALVMPSAIEGFGIVVIEANACGTPVIASNRVPAAIDGYNSIVVPCFDVNSISNAIIKLLSDEKKWRELSIHSFEQSKQFTWSKSVNQFISLIKRIQFSNGANF